MYIFNRVKITARLYPRVSKISMSSWYTFLNKDFVSVYMVLSRSKHRRYHVSFLEEICNLLKLNTISRIYSDNCCILEHHSEMNRLAFCKEVALGMQTFSSIVFFSVSEIFIGEIILFNISIRSLTQGSESHLNKSFLSITV